MDAETFKGIFAVNKAATQMKVVLIDAPMSFKQLYGTWDLSGVDTYCPPLGLLYIASFIRAHNHVPYVLDPLALRWSLQKCVDYILSINPDVVGISAKTANIYNANEIAVQLKKSGLKVPIIIGGAHTTAVPFQTLERFSSLDFGVIGEGEITFLELIEKIQNKEPVNTVKGIVWRNDSGKLLLNQPRPLVSDLDILPLPAWDLLPNFPEAYPHNALETKRLPAASIMTSRGCPFQCTFCDRAVFGSVVRYHSVEYTIKMLRYLVDKYRIKDVMVLDDNFLLDKKNLFRICEAMIRERLDLSWFCIAHAKSMTEDRLEKIRQSGCWMIEVGIESGCDRILNLLRKNTNKSEIASAVKRARMAGLKVKGNFIFGLPTETKESLDETIQFATSIDLSLMNVSFLTMWPGCELSKNAEHYGHSEMDWIKLAHHRVTFIPNGLSEEYLVMASKRAFLRFYLRPKIILENLHLFASFRGINSALVGLKTFLKTVFRKNAR